MNWWQRLGGPNGITLLGWVILAPISIVFTADVVPEGYLPGWSRLDGYIVGTAAHLATGFVLLIGKFLVRRISVEGLRPFATVLVMGISGLARGAVTSWLLVEFQITAQADVADRLASGAALIIIWFTAIAIVVDSRQRYRQSYRDLSEQVEQQRLLRERGGEILAQREATLIEQVRATLQEALRVGSKTADIHNAVDQLVRPLSHNLAQTRPDIKSSEVKPRIRIRLWPIARSAFARTPYSYGPVIFVSVLGTFYSKLWQMGIFGVIDSLLSALFIWFFFWLGTRFRKYGWWAWLFWFAAGLASGLTTGLFTGINPLENPTPVIYLSLNVVIPAVMVAFLKAYDYQAESNLLALRELLESVQWETVALQQQAWVQQKRIARFVHSDLQARIRAFALRLEIAGDQPKESDIEELRQECEASLALGGEYQDFGKFIEELRDLWEGVVEIDLFATEDARELLTSDGFTQIALVEIVREAVNNAVKHGRATTVQVALSVEHLIERQNLLIRVSDNGSAAAGKGQGLGSEILNQLTLDWDLDLGETGATLSASVPVRQLANTVMTGT